uniref:Uncharacterized protein n=1 Tax=Scophthalmus maximus TaxID=52904 RepID=A0A8D3DTR6_SCOMX
MAEYKLQVTTGDLKNAGTWDHVFITLFGDEGQKERTELDNFGPDFTTGTVRTYTIKTSSSLGKLLLVKVEKDPFIFFPEDEWHCSKIVVTTPEGEVILFPCNRWISRGENVELRGGRAMKVFEEEHPLLIDHRKNELMHKQMVWNSKYVTEHWQEDDFYGSQFLNGINPNVIKRCSELPPNFPVTEEMVKPFLDEGASLKREMEKGNIFLYDQKKMDGIPTRVYDGEPLPLTPGLCLFYVNPEKKLMPIAIQLHQQPSEQNPIFLPSDPETDWLLAKMFIKNADILDHEAVHHLMCTHFMSDVYAIATLRCFPVIHPLYKLLIPHFRDTVDINTAARASIVGPTGIFNKTSLGCEGMIELMRRSHAETTYSSVCLPENITARGLESIPNFYYRDDGLKLWTIINSFVKAVVEYYYPTDTEVHKDTELQEWISEIFTHGLLENKGFPACFHTTEELIRFITMVIFTVSVQHAAVNNGQFDYHYWMPNGTLLLHKPPPTTKGQTSMKTILESLPNVGEAVAFSALFWILSTKYTDTVHLGEYPEERFDEPAPKQMIKEFQAELLYLGEKITKRNSQLEVPYTYLHPDYIESSVTI